MSEDLDVFKPPPQLETVRVRVERRLGFVSRELMTEHKAMGGQTKEEAGLDPDLPLPEATAMMVEAWAKSHDGILGYLAQWGLLEAEVVKIHNVRVYVEGKLIHEEDIV